MPPLGESGSRNLYKILDVVTFLQLLHIFFSYIASFLKYFDLKQRALSSILDYSKCM